MNQRNIIIAGCVFAVLMVGLFIVKGNAPSVASISMGGKKVAVQSLVDKAAQKSQDGSVLEAKALYQQILTDFPDFEQNPQIQSELEKLNIRIMFSNAEIPEKTLLHEVKPGETLGGIAKQYNSTVNLIKISNNLKSDTIRTGQRLRIWKGDFNAFVDKSQNILILKDGEEIVKVYHVSTGSNNSTPVGEFKITSKLVDPVWFNKGIVVPPDSPENVLGSRWMGFNLAGYGIHGTVDPDAIGQQVTAGCVRLRNNEVEELYDILPMGTLVKIVD